MWRLEAFRVFFSCFTWLEKDKSENSGFGLKLCKNMAMLLQAVCHTAAVSHSVQLNSPQVTSAVTEGREPKFIQGQGLKFNILFSVVCRGGVHTPGWGDLSAREWEAEHQAGVQRHRWARPPGGEHQPGRPGPWGASWLHREDRPLFWGLPVQQQLWDTAWIGTHYVFEWKCQWLVSPVVLHLFSAFLIITI